MSGALLARNALLNLSTGLFLLLVNLVLVPLMLRAFGTTLYGVLSLTWLVLAHAGWLDLGLSRAAAKRVAEDLAAGRPEQAALWARTALLTQGALGLVGAVALALSAPALVSVLRVGAQQRDLALLALRLFAFALPLDLAARSLIGVLQACQRFDLINALSVANLLGTYAVYALGIARGGDFPAVVLGLFLLRVAHLLGVYWAAGRQLSALGAGRWARSKAKTGLAFAERPAPSAESRSEASSHWSRVRQMARFGGWVTVTAIVGPLLLYLDQWVIVASLGVAMLPFYTVPFNLLARLALFPASLTTTLFPAFSALAMQTQWERIEGYFVRAHRYLALALLPLLFLLFVWSGELLRVWIGIEFAERAALPMRVLLIGFGVALLAPLSGSLLEAAGRPDLPAKIYLIELPLNLLAVYLLTRRYGLPGAAASYTLRAIVETCALWWAVYRVLPLSTARMWRESALPVALPLLLMVGVAALMPDARFGDPAAMLGTLLTLTGYGIGVLHLLRREESFSLLRRARDKAVRP